MSRVIRVGDEYKKHESIEPEKVQVEVKDKPVDNEDKHENEAEVPVSRAKRKSTEGWKNTLVTDIGNQAGTNQFILLEITTLIVFLLTFFVE